MVRRPYVLLWSIIASFTICGLFLPAVALTELITNSTFDTNITGWSKSTSGSVAWAATEGHAAPGALQATNTRASTSTYSAGAIQCVVLPAPQASYYTVQGWIKVPTQSNSTAQGYIRLQFYLNADCSSSTGSTRDTALVSAGSPWTFVTKTTSWPSGAQSVEVRLYVRKSGTASAYAYFDDISLFPSTSNAVAMIDPDSPLPSLHPSLSFRFRGILLLAVAIGLAFLTTSSLSTPAYSVDLLVHTPKQIILAIAVLFLRTIQGETSFRDVALTFTAPPPTPHHLQEAAFAERRPSCTPSQGTPWLPRDISPPGQRSIFLDPIIPSPPPSPAVKLVVDREGLYVVTGADLASVPDWDPQADPRTFRLIRRGQEIPIWLEGGADGRFDRNDRFLFYGQPRPDNPMFTKYGTNEVYWLTWGGHPGLRLADRDAQPAKAAPLIDKILHTERLEQDREWYTHHTLEFPTRDTWWWGRIRTAGAPVQQTFSGHIPSPAPDTPATLTYEVTSRNREGTHHLRVGLNGKWLDERFFGDHTLHVYTATVPAGLLESHVSLTLQVFPQESGRENIYFNGYSITYTRTLSAENGLLAFGVAPDRPSTLVLTNFPPSGVEVWDVTQPASPVRLRDFMVQHDGDREVLRVGVHSGKQRIIAASQTAMLSPRLESYTSVDWRDPSWAADVIIITSTDLMPATRRLAAYRRGQGLRVVVVDVSTLYDEFAWGWYHPEAIRAFLAYAHSHWRKPAPRYVVLLGDGHWNFRRLNVEKYGPLPPNHVPPYLAWVDPWQGEAPVDQAYATFAGNDEIPDMIVGRIPVDTLSEAQAVVDKVIAYEQADHAGWRRHALFVADNPDRAGDFPVIMRELATVRLSSIRADSLSLSDQDTEATRSALLRALNQDTFLVVYSGHGGVDRWAGEPLLTTGDLSSLKNTDVWPIVVTFNCLDGYFAYPSMDQEWQSMAETMLRLSGRGSIAAWSPAGLGNINRQEPLATAFLQELTSPGDHRLGDIVHRARMRFCQQYGPDAIFFTQTLLGDPLLRLRIPHTTVFPYVTSE